MTKTCTFAVRDVPIYGDLILAPLAGFSDLPYRSICRAMGSAISYSECIPARGYLNQNPNVLQLAQFGLDERPVALQVVGSDPDEIVETCRRLELLGPDMIDINMGCPAPRVSNRGGGAGLMRDPAKIARIFSALSMRLSVPCTGKIRLGWDHSSLNYLEVAHILEDNGASLIAVHGRTRCDRYDVPADWDAIAEVVQTVHVPVLANGDVRRSSDIVRIVAHTGCQGVMIGRGAIGNPWVFQRRDLDTVPLEERIEVIRYHLDRMVAFYGEQRGVLAFRKHIVRYLRGLYGAARVRPVLMTLKTRAEVIECLETNPCLHPV
jgi:nifR3 family TIM-barrel protein